MITLNGYLLHLFQLCRRKYLLESNWRYLPWHPSTLFAACMRQAILALSNSNSSSLQSIITSAINQFTSNCKTPGLDAPHGTDTYSLAMDYCSCIRTVLTYLSTTSLPPLHTLAPVIVPPHPDLTWSFLSLEDESGTLHRWVFPDFINDSSRLKEGHSWELFGDLVLSNSSMNLHMVSIGRRDSSSPHLLSPWCRAYRSPAVNMLRFQKKSGEGLSSNWKPYYFSREDDPEVWVDKMLEDGVIDTIYRTYLISPPDPVYTFNFHQDLNYEFKQIKALESTSFADLPITRPVCDSPYPCQHQFVCYSKEPLKEVEGCGLYERLNVKRKLGRPSEKI